jgi:hypothetical protein
MTSAPPSKSTEVLSRTDVEKIIDARISEFKKIAKAFLLGFSLLIIILVANRFVSQNSLLVFLHDQIFGTERYLAGAINKSVALSYSSEFMLTSAAQVQYASFYANPTQTVIGLIEVKHSGPSEPSEVLVRLDQFPDPVWRGTEDLDFNKIDLTKMVREPARMSSPAENVHNLTFQLKGSNESPGDSVHVRILINIIGLEAKLE